MDAKSYVKELKALLKVLRENGVLFYKTSELELKLSSEASLVVKDEQEQSDTINTPDELTDEQLMYYSVAAP